MPPWHNGNPLDTNDTKEMIDIAALTQHPERLDRDTLYELRSLLALYPYYQTVRLLLLQMLLLSLCRCCFRWQVLQYIRLEQLLSRLH